VTAPTGGPAATRVSRRTRLVDAAALLLIVGGAAVYLYAHYRMGELAAGRMTFDRMPKPGTNWNLAVWNDLVTTSRVGLGLAGAGIAVGLVSFVRHLLERRSASTDAQADHP
jgi:hypothetical protein